MAERFQLVILPSILFLLTIALAGALGCAVVLSPWFYQEGVSTNRFLQLFATDMTVRRTTCFSALGMLVTACVFFRPQWVAKPSQ